jgi:hypothetical protein
LSVINMLQHGYIPFGLVALIFTCMLASGSVSMHGMSDQSIRGTSQDYGTMSSGKSIDTNAFIDADCTADVYNLNCSNLGLDKQFGCIQISNASTALGSLSPKLPMVKCLFRKPALTLYPSGDKDYNSKEGIVREGCMFSGYRSYIVKQDEEFKLIRTKEEFQSMFAPVETQEEAMSFAVALTGSILKYDTSAPEGYFPVASPIKPTYVEETDGRFKVHLFHRESCGCGTHPYYAIDYIITRAGNVTELSRQKVYDSNHKICVD